MNKKERHKLIIIAKTKLELINEIRHSFEYFDSKATNYIYSNFNFSDVYEYFLKTFELLDIETDKEIPFNDSFFRFFGLLQIIYVQQDLTDAIAKVFGVNLENNLNRSINRQLRDELVGHPLSNERNSKQRNKKENTKKSDKIQSTIILRNITSNSFHYVSYHPENEEEEQFIDKIAYIDAILEREIAFLNNAFDKIMVKCFKEIQRQFSKFENYIKSYYNVKIPELSKYESWFKQYVNTTSFELEVLRNCALKREKHKKYEVYLVEFERMIVVSYLEMVDRIKTFYEKLQNISSTNIDIKFNCSMIVSLTSKQNEIENYFPKSDNQIIKHDLRDISMPFNDLWSVGFNQLTRVFSNEVDVINELNYLKKIKSDAIEYEISYRYIRFLVGYS